MVAAWLATCGEGLVGVYVCWNSVADRWGVHGAGAVSVLPEIRPRGHFWAGIVRRSRSLAAAVGLAVVMTSAWATPVYADAGAWLSEVDAVVAASPSDATLRAANDADLIDLAVRCVPIDTETYCLHRGWDSQGTASSALANAKQAAVRGETAGEGSGDMSLLTYLKGWAKLPYTQRVALERQELNDAKLAVGKVVYFDAMINGGKLPADYATRYPAMAAWAGVGGTVQPMDAPGHYSCTYPDGYELCYVMTGAYFKKQETGYYCGPTAMQGIAWNNPSGGIYKDQSAWASILGTTQANGTYIGSIASAINSYTTWDDYAGSYVVVSISTWTDSQWQSLFVTHVQNKKSPVLLHPRFTGTNSSYYRGRTSGHFNVGRGFDTTSGQFMVMILEPAGGPAENNVYPYVSAEDTVANVRQQNLDNTNQRDIAY